MAKQLHTWMHKLNFRRNWGCTSSGCSLTTVQHETAGSSIKLGPPTKTYSINLWHSGPTISWDLGAPLGASLVDYTPKSMDRSEIGPWRRRTTVEDL